MGSLTPSSRIQIVVETPADRADAVVLRLAGEMGIGAVLGDTGKHSGVGGDTALADMLADAVPAPPPLVVLDVSGVTYLSSLGMGALLRLQKHVKNSGGEMRLAGATPLLSALLKRMMLDGAFEFYPDVDAALA